MHVNAHSIKKSQLDSLSEPHNESKQRELASKKKEISSDISCLEAELQYVPALQKAFSKKEGISEIYLYFPPGGYNYRLHIYINKGTTISIIGQQPDFDFLVPNPKDGEGKPMLAFYNQGGVEHHLRQVESIFLESILPPATAIFGGHSRKDYEDLRNKTSSYSSPGTPPAAEIQKQ